MKTRSFITILSILFTLVMVSCSTEGDILDDMAKVEVPATSGVEAAISCSLYNNVMTKGETDKTQDAEGAEANIDNAIFFLVKGNDVLGCSTVKDGKIYTKNQSGLKVIAITSLSSKVSSELSVMTKVNDIKDYTLTNLSDFTKMGETDVNFLTPTADHAEVNVTVSQIAARIDLVKVNITKVAADKVTLKKVELLDQVTSGKLNGTVVVRGTSVEAGLNPANGNACDSLYSFAGENVKLQLTFDVDGKEVVCNAFTVKHKVGDSSTSEVKAGYVYRITYNVKVTGENVEPTVSFEVAPWKASTISGDMVEVNN